MPVDALRPSARPASRWRAPLYLHIATVFLAVLGVVAVAVGLVAGQGLRDLVDSAVSAAFEGSAELTVREVRRLESRARIAAEALAADAIAAAGDIEERADGPRALAMTLRAVPGISAAYIGWPSGDFLLLRPVGAQAARLAAPAGTAWLAQWIDRDGQRFHFLDERLALLERRDRIDYDFDPRTRPWFREARTDQTIVTEPYVFFTTLEPGITAARRAASGAVAGVDLSLWDLSARLPTGRPVPDSESAILDPTGRVLAHSDPTRLERVLSVRSLNAGAIGANVLPTAAEIGSPILESLAGRVQRGERTFSGALDLAGREWYLRGAPLGGRGLTFVMAAPLDQLAAVPNAIRRRLLLVLGLAVLLGVPAVWLVARLLARPVEAFARQADAVARLDFTGAAPVATRVGELAELDAAFGAMRQAVSGFTSVARRFVDEEDAGRLLEGTLDAVMTAAGAERGAAWLTVDGGDLNVPRVVRGGDGDGPLAIGRRIAESPEPMVLTMSGSDPALGPLAGPSGPVVVLGIPLPTGRGDVVGAIAVVRRDGESAAAILAVADAIARPVALAIDRCRLLAEQRAHLEQLRLFENAVSRLNDIVVITAAQPVDGPDGPRIVYVNEAFVARTGFPRDEAIGRTPRILQGAGTDPGELRRIGAALRRWEPVRSEVLNFTKAGEEIWLDIDIVPIADETGRYTHWVAVERDVTERKRAEATSILDQERFRLAMEATNDAIWDWDVQADRIWWNGGLANQFGRIEESEGGGSAARLARIHPTDRARIRASLEAVLRSTAATWREEYRLARADGTYAIVVDRGSVMRSPSGKALRMVGSVRDVTERREFEERLRQSQKLEAVGQLTGGVAHDFNNLLTIIIGNAEVLVDGLAPNPKLRELAAMIATAGERGAELTTRLLAFARRQALEPRPVGLRELVEGMQGLLRRTLTADIALRVEAPAGLPQALVDAGQLEVALLNLALNARDAMPGGGVLTFSMAPAEAEGGRFVELAVSDTGTGMEPEVAARAFDPFFTTKAIGKGSGLGLSMVYGFIRQSNGHARIDSRPGEGTTVRLFLPMAAGREAPPAGAPRAAAVARGTEAILVVEDEPLVREHATSQLRELGYQVEAVATGAAALEYLAGPQPVDLLFSDVVMPGGINGRQLAAEARRLRPGLPILLTSGYAEAAVLEAARQDALPLLDKPYRRDGLAAAVRKALEGG